MMRTIALLLASLMISAASAQMIMVGVENGKSGPAYLGPGDVVAGWRWWGGVRAFSSTTRGTRALNVCDATNSTCADVSTDAVTGNIPASITIGATNCSGGTCTVQKVYDQTGNLFCTGSVACDYVQTTANLRPFLLINCIGTFNRWCLNWTAGQTAQLMAIPNVAQSNPWSLSMILLASNSSNSNYMSDTTDGYQLRHTAAANGIEFYDGTGPFSATMSDGAFHGVHLNYGSAGNVAVFIDGSSTSLANTGAGVMQNMSIGGGNGLPCTCKMGEAGIFNGPLTGPQVTSLNSNQHTWGGF